MTEAGWTVCIECGMMCEAVEYHPYAACLMFKQCLNSETVRANLQAGRDDSYHQGRVAGLREVQEEYTRLFKLTQPVAQMLKDLRIIPIGCSREQELAWKMAVKDLRHYQRNCADALIEAQEAQKGGSL